MPEKKDIYTEIDELLREFGIESDLGSTALKDTTSVEVIPNDKADIMAGKIGYFASGLFPRLPNVA